MQIKKYFAFYIFNSEKFFLYYIKRFEENFCESNLDSKYLKKVEYRKRKTCYTIGNYFAVMVSAAFLGLLSNNMNKIETMNVK